MSVLFDLRDLRKTFSRRNVVAVRDVSLQLSAGDSIGVIGESGSGKSTLARMMMGLERPDSGVLDFRGMAVSKWMQRRRREWLQQVQFVFQDPMSSLNPRRRIRDQLEAPLLHLTGLGRSERGQRLSAALESTRLAEDCLERFPHEFSGGQAQRIAIARALVVQPSVLILDEAVSALDVSVQATILNLLRDLQSERPELAMLFISHDMGVVDYLCRRIVVMRAGSIVEEGSRERVMVEPGHPYTRELLDSVLSLD